MPGSPLARSNAPLRPRRSTPRLVLAALAALQLLGGATATALDEPSPTDEPTLDGERQPAVTPPGPARPIALDADRWRARGMAFVDLPLGVRARFNATYTRNLYVSEDLAARYAIDMGPAISGQRFLESRFALSRAISDRVELEIAWGTRNLLEGSDPMRFDRQTVAAMIRITP